MLKVFLLLIVSCFLLLPAAAQADSSKARTGDRIIELRGWPGGPAIGKIYPKVPVRKSDKERGEWVRVRLSGWVKKADLTGAKSSGADLSPRAAVTPVAVVPVELVSFEVREGKRDILGQPNAIVFDLTVKNVTGAVVPGWKGILVIQDQEGNILARTLATHDNANLAPEAEGQVSFFWEKGDDEYLKLMNANRETLEVTLHQVKGL